jgi:hypothetical protein
MATLFQRPSTSPAARTIRHVGLLVAEQRAHLLVVVPRVLRGLLDLHPRHVVHLLSRVSCQRW